MNKNLLNGVIKSIPRKWTNSNIKELLDLKKNKTIKEISKIFKDIVNLKYKEHYYTNLI